MSSDTPTTLQLCNTSTVSAHPGPVDQAVSEDCCKADPGDNVARVTIAMSNAGIATLVCL